MRKELIHFANPLHIFCRLLDAGFSKEIASPLGKIYEHVIYRPLFLWLGLFRTRISNLH